MIHLKAFNSIHPATVPFFMMKVPVLLAILSFFSSSLASPLQSWDDICEATPPEAETIVNGQKFKYICRYQHIGASTAQPGTFDHPDKCAELIVGEPGTVVSWTSKGKCYKAAGPGTKENTRTKVLAMEKVDDDDDLIVDPDDDLKTCNDKLKKAEEDLEKCENESKPPTTPPTTPPSTSPTCMSTSFPHFIHDQSRVVLLTPMIGGKKHDQGGKEWEVTCDESKMPSLMAINE